MCNDETLRVQAGADTNEPGVLIRDWGTAFMLSLTAHPAFGVGTNMAWAEAGVVLRTRGAESERQTQRERERDFASPSDRGSGSDDIGGPYAAMPRLANKRWSVPASTTYFDADVRGPGLGRERRAKAQRSVPSSGVGRVRSRSHFLQGGARCLRSVDWQSIAGQGRQGGCSVVAP